ncbi:helix-turn-helix transcriptional regulator [Defluviimonas sp. WL0024]|uniref:Helix-turn-helix transcriptional regulator n=1 Tax=Albidovulum salinarum TaxID=2984153 RepID=A0ABT2X2U4_9RHOB|nr:helix-turn-helix transcriptional regulator [Defluviimonas sp. WL0024]MCU9848268.1 helix-turn-helix transcriptional regulator [Defluviimonas sp. WL0024]
MRRPILFACLAGALYAALFTVEHIRTPDPFDPVTLAADIAELLLLIGAVVFTANMLVESRDMRRERAALMEGLVHARRDSEHWRKTARAHVEGLSRAISTQFRAWELTSAEADVAGLMLKGLSHKEIAALRDSTVATVRQHAASVYRKSNLTNRTQLIAFFLEDLLMPDIGADGTPSNVSVLRQSSRD